MEKSTEVKVYEFGDDSMVRVDRISRMFVDKEGALIFYVLGSTVKHSNGFDGKNHYKNIMAIINGENK